MVVKFILQYFYKINKVTNGTTHLVTTKDAYDHETTKVDKEIKIVNEDFIHGKLIFF
jgi:hypothetical protein